MDQEIRNKLRNVVTQCRKLLEESISQELEGKYAIFAKKDQVTADPSAKMTHLSDEEQAARKDILDHFAHIKARGFKPKDALDQLIREIAFTHLNRLCAYKMMEAREVFVGGQKFREAVSRGVNSNGVKFYLAEHPEEERLFNTGHQDIAYRHFLDWLGGALSDEVGVLFNPNDPANRLYPRQRTLDEVVDLLNGGGIKAEETELRDQWPQIWSQDETIGWVYQYFTPKDFREAAKDPSKGGSHVPRNSYELAFRNQFFTPRYVVEFLTDNTLGRIWYEMRKGDTKLGKEGDPAQCRYMVRRPTEIFLQEGEQMPKEAAEGKDDLSQDELLKLPVHIPHRPKKDPRDLKILDPACGSGHFLLYCFDLLLTIYEEAYSDPDLSPALKHEYPTLDAFKRNVPRLILAHNLHGIDIDLRASQIAALALWLRCQRAYQGMELKKDRPKITRSNFVCAEPMPGEVQMLKEFVGQLEPKVLGQVVEVVFDKMKLAGEAGSLLKIEEEIRDAVAAAKKQYIRETTQATDRKGQPLLFTQAAMDRLAGRPVQPSLFDLSDITDNQFFEEAESRVIETLRSYAEKAHNGQRLQRRLFSEDAVRGFAFVELCQQRYDVVLMNPPFGEPSPATRDLAKSYCPNNATNLLTSFVGRSHELAPTGSVGAITDSTWLKKTDYEPLRQMLLEKCALPFALADLGWGVLDEANVATCAFVSIAQHAEQSLWAFRLVAEQPDQRGTSLHASVRKVANGTDLTGGVTESRLPMFLRPWSFFERFPNRALAYETPAPLVSAFISWSPLSTYVTPRRGYTPGDTFRFFRCWWEVPLRELGRSWWTLNNGSPYTPVMGQGFFVALHDGPSWDRYRECAGFRLESEQWFGRGGIGWGKRTDFMYAHPLPDHAMFSNEGPAVYPSDGAFWPVLGWLNTNVCQALINLYCGQHKTAGYVADVPCPDPKCSGMKTLGEITHKMWSGLQPSVSRDETLERFVAVVRPIEGETLEQAGKTLHAAADDFRRAIGEMNAVARKMLEDVCGYLPELSVELPAEPNLASCIPLLAFMEADQIHPADVLQWALGIVFGRWDIRCATSTNGDMHCVEATAAVPQLSPGMLSSTSLETTSATPPGYPTRIQWEGIIVEDSEHSDDIVRSLSEVMEVLWRNDAATVESRFRDVLAVRDFRDYFRKSGKGGFWDDHISRYSKSRRKAPIYWLLQSSKKNYAIWLYYHRFDKDLLFKALVNYVEPKIRLETSRLESLRTEKAAAGDSGKEAKRLAKDVERQEDFLSELRDFEDKLRRAASLYLEPDLNDGVVLNIAPLHELVPWKEAKKYWDELMDGKYEWSSIGKQLREKGLVK
jgi:hypothetical protein